MQNLSFFFIACAMVLLSLVFAGGELLTAWLVTLLQNPVQVPQFFLQRATVYGVLTLTGMGVVLGAVAWGIRKGTFHPNGMPRFILFHDVTVFPHMPPLARPMVLTALAIVLHAATSVAIANGNIQSKWVMLFLALPYHMVPVVLIVRMVITNLRAQMNEMFNGDRLLTGQKVESLIVGEARQRERGEPFFYLEEPIIHASKDSWLAYNEDMETFLLYMALQQARQPWYARLKRLHLRRQGH